MSFKKNTCIADHNFIPCTSFNALKGCTMRFYTLDGIEEDIQDIKFHIDENELLDNLEAIEELLENYV